MGFKTLVKAQGASASPKGRTWYTKTVPQGEGQKLVAPGGHYDTVVGVVQIDGGSPHPRANVFDYFCQGVHLELGENQVSVET